MAKDKIIIEDVIDTFRKGIESLREQLQSKSKDKGVILGHSADLRDRLKQIHRDIEIANKLIDQYIDLYQGKKRSLATVKDLVELTGCCQHMSPDNVQLLLKKLYVQWDKISIPGFKIKPEKLVEMHDWPEAIETKMLSIADLMRDLKFHGIAKYFSDTKVCYEFTQKHEDELILQNTRFASEEDIDLVLSLDMLCKSLTRTRISTHYSFRELPEIDFRLKRFMSVDESGNHVSFDLNKYLGDKIITHGQLRAPVIEIEFA